MQDNPQQADLCIITWTLPSKYKQFFCCGNPARALLASAGLPQLFIFLWRFRLVLRLPQPGHPKWCLHRGHWSMNRLLLSFLATTAAWILFRTSNAPTRVVPAKEAAAILQQAWADHHTTA